MRPFLEFSMRRTISMEIKKKNNYSSATLRKQAQPFDFGDNDDNDTSVGMAGGDVTMASSSQIITSATIIL